MRKLVDEADRQRSLRIGKLTTVLEVAAELGSVYRAARRGRIDAVYANRLATILTALRACLEASEFERRLQEIEAAVGKNSEASSTILAFKPRDVS